MPKTDHAGETHPFRVARFACVLAATAAVAALSASGAFAGGSGAASRIAACANSDASVANSSLAVIRKAVLCLVNQERKRFGLPALLESNQLDASAQAHSSDMVRHHYFSHNAPNGSTPSQRITAAGYTWSAYGENIAAGYPTPLSVITVWMSDVGHCSNILFPDFADVGVGAVASALPGHAIGPAVWTQDFGRRSGAATPSSDMRPANSCPHGL
jgi:uncharacterized protein YkwD